MKAQRRHELRENDLVHYLRQGRDYLKEHGSKLAVALVVVIVVVSASLWVVRSRTQAVNQAWISRSALTFADHADLGLFGPRFCPLLADAAR